MTRPIRLGSTPAPLTLWLVHGSPFVAALRADRPWPAAPALVLDDGTELLAELDADDSTVAAWLVDSVTIAGLLDRDPERVTLLDPASRMAYAHGLVRSTATVPGELSTTIPATGRLDVRQLDADRIQIGYTTNITNVQQVSELSGTGSPVGTVDAELGQTYRDTAGTNGALRWVKTGPALTDWSVDYGDTGTRAITSLLAATPWESQLSTVTIRRTGNQVVLNLNVAVAAGTLLQWWPTILNLPQGFYPATRVTTITPDTWLGWEHGPLVVGAGSSGYVALETPLDEMTVPSGGMRYFEVSMMYSTADQWPASLPGVPA